MSPIVGNFMHQSLQHAFLNNKGHFTFFAGYETKQQQQQQQLKASLIAPSLATFLFSGHLPLSN